MIPGPFVPRDRGANDARRPYGGAHLSRVPMEPGRLAVGLRRVQGEFAAAWAMAGGTTAVGRRQIGRPQIWRSRAGKSQMARRARAAAACVTTFNDPGPAPGPVRS